MKKTTLAAAFLIFTGLLGAVRAADKMEVMKVYLVQKAVKPPVLDGRLTGEIWQQAQLI